MNDFMLAYDSFVPEEEGLREALTSTGNGYFCARGAVEWEDAHDVHYPGTYAHGGYNRETSIMGGRPVLNEDLVNLPNWLVLKLRIEGEEAIGLDNIELLTYRVSAHSSSDDPSRYRDEKITEVWRHQRDPLRRTELWLRNKGWLAAGERDEMCERLDLEVRESVARAEATEAPSLETIVEDVFEEPTWLLREQMHELAAATRVKSPHQH